MPDCFCDMIALKWLIATTAPFFVVEVIIYRESAPDRFPCLPRFPQVYEGIIREER